MVEHDLEQALFARLGEGLEQLLERQILMRLRPQGSLSGLCQQLNEWQTRIHLGAQHLGIDEEADQALGFQAWAVGIRHADADVALPAVAMQQALKRGQQEHVRRGLMGLGGLANGIAQVRPQAHGMAGGAVQLLRRARVVGGQVQGWMLIAQLRLPISQLALALPLRQPLALPTAVVGVLGRQWRERGLLSLGSRRVQPGKFVDQHIHRPAVSDDVMQRHQQLVIFVVEAHQRYPEQRPLLQVELSARFVLADLPSLGFTLGQRQIADIDALQIEFSGRNDLLQRHPVTLEETCAQGFVALDQLLETAAQGVFVQFAAQAQGTGNVVGAALRVELPGDPQAILRQGLRHGLATRQRADRALGEATVLLLPRHRVGEGTKGRRFEQQAQVQLQAKLFPQTRHHLRGRDGVAAQQEEVIVGSDLLDLQLLAPDLADQALQLTGGLNVACAFCDRRREQRITVEAAFGQAIAARRALQFAAGSLGQGARIEQHHHARRFLVRLGHGLADSLDQGLGREDFLHTAADLRSDADAFLAIDIDRKGGDAPLAHHFHFTLDGLLDVLWIKVVPAHDQHVFPAPGDEQLTVARETQVTGAQPFFTCVLDEGLGRGFGVAPVTVGDARAAGPDFADRVVSQFVERCRVHDQHRVIRLADAAAHDRAALAGFGTVLRQGPVVHSQIADALAARSTGDEQRGFRQTVGGHETVFAETAAGELLGETFQGVEANRFRPGIGHAPAAQVEAFQGRLTDSFTAQAIGKIRPATNGAAVFTDRFQPAQRPAEEVRRRHQHARHATENRLQQAADQAHVVIQRQPADDHVVGVQVDTETVADQQFVGHQVAVADLHALGQCGGTRGVLQEGDVSVYQGWRDPAFGVGAVEGIDTQQRRRPFDLQQRIAQAGTGQQQARLGIADDRQQPLLMMPTRRLRRIGRHRDHPGV